MPRRPKHRVPALLLASALAPPALFAADLETLFAQTQASGSLTLAFEDQAVVVSGVVPLGAVAWLGLASVPDTYSSTIVRHEGLEPSGPDGTLRIELQDVVPPKSVWAAVELATGRLALGAPGEFPLQPAEFPGRGLALGAAGQLSRFTADREELDLLYVRPGVGAWGLHAGDGGATDADGEENAALAAALDEARPLGGSPPAPSHLLPGDVLIVFDPRTLEFYAARLPGAPAQP